MSDLDFLKPFLRDHVLEKGSLSNEGKRHLTLVYSYWLKLLSIYFNDVGVTSRSIKVLKETIKESPDNSVPYAIHAFYNQSRRSAEINKKKKLNFFFALLLLRVILFLNDNKIYLIKTKKIPFLLSSLFMAILNRSQFLEINEKDKKEFFKKVKKQEFSNKEMIQLLEDCIPRQIFSERKSKEEFFEKVEVHCYPDSMFHAREILNFIFYFKELKIIGYQHGANYGVWNENHFENWEKRISNRFIYWYPFSEGFYGRGEILNNENKLDNKRILWIGRRKPNNLIKNMIPSAYTHLKEIEHLEKIDDIFSKEKNLLYLPHPNTSSWVPKKTSISAEKGIVRFVRPGKDILLFDNICETSLYLALEYNVPFFIILNAPPIDGMTVSYQKYLEILRDNQLLFYASELERVKLFATSLLESEKFYEEQQQRIVKIKKLRL